MNNLFIAFNSKENFKVLICAADEKSADMVAKEYAADSFFEGEFCISSFELKDERFDCDYVLVEK